MIVAISIVGSLALFFGLISIIDQTDLFEVSLATIPWLLTIVLFVLALVK